MASNLNKRPAKEKALTPLQRACLHSVEFYPETFVSRTMTMRGITIMVVEAFNAESGTRKDFSVQWRALLQRRLVVALLSEDRTIRTPKLTPAGRAALYGWGEIPQEVI